MLKSFKEIMKKAESGKPRPLAVADAAGAAVIEALHEAAKLNIIKPFLVGDPEKIKPIVEKIGLKNYELVEAKEPGEIAKKSIQLIHDGKCEMLMKGKLSTPILLKAVLDKKTGLRKGKLLSHVAVTEAPNYPKLMLFTDGGMNIRPDLMQKIEILKNAAWVANGLGIETPKAAALAAIEVVNDDMPETIDAALLAKMSDRGQLGNIIVDGPIAIDVVLSKDAAAAKKMQSPLTEDADIFLLPDIASGNISVKSLIYLAGATVGGIVVGATVPIVLLSRADSAAIKLASIALAAALDV
ncbi:MAG: bifunctional enoyl-CoA hydratase/phosphate acetyltransferase [Candidatus Zixiibacteriota bacterium]